MKTGYPAEARRVVINTIIMTMVSDCLHHIFEALKCFEKRKVVVGFNLLRKPLKQNLLYLAWMLGNEDGFYTEFMSGNPENLSQKKIGNLRQQIFTNAIAKMPNGSPFVPEILEKLIYDRKFDYGFERAFEHAVHCEQPRSRTSEFTGERRLDRLGIDRERRDRSAIMGRQSTAEIEDLETDAAAMNYVEQVIGAA